MGQKHTNLRRGRSARTLRDLARTPTSNAALPLLSQETLVQALQHVSMYLAAKNRQITLIVVGGVVNTLLLENRVHTRDVDFFNDNLTVEDTAFILQGTKYATKMNRSLEPQWLNNHTVLLYR